MSLLPRGSYTHSEGFILIHLIFSIDDRDAFEECKKEGSLFRMIDAGSSSSLYININITLKEYSHGLDARILYVLSHLTCEWIKLSPLKCPSFAFLFAPSSLNTIVLALFLLLLFFSPATKRSTYCSEASVVSFCTITMTDARPVRQKSLLSLFSQEKNQESTINTATTIIIITNTLERAPSAATAE